MRKRIITIVLTGSTVLAVHHGPAPQERPTHPCHEDEAAIVQPAGLYCVPVDNLNDMDAIDRAIAESGRAAYWPSEYDIAPRNAHDTDPGH